jgi:sugar/nucleoside kinase (ribokinase family)
MPPFDLLVAGEINPDLILDGDFTLKFGQAEEFVDSATLTIGSSSVIFACGAARLGLKTAFKGICGDDLFGKFMLEQMQLRNVDPGFIQVVSGGSTGLSVILNRGLDRMILTHTGLIAALKAEDITDDLLRQARHLHVAGYFIQDGLRPGLPDLFQRAHRMGLTTSLDTNFDPSEHWEGLSGLLPYADIFFPNEREALSITRRSNPTDALLSLADVCGMVAMKCGASGAKLAMEEEIIHVDSIPVNVADTVGAGDSFDAGFIYGFLNSWELEKSLRLAAVCGALSTQSSGGTAAQATLIEAQQYL